MKLRIAWLGMLIILCFTLTLIPQEKRDSIVIGDMKVKAGETISGYLPVPVEEENDCFIPITIIHGTKPGKILALAAGVHGYEYPPIHSLYRLKEMISPEDLSGTLILVHIANLPSFQKRTIYYNPYDWKNLNRVFPGNPNGTQSERIAYVLVEQIVKKCDYLIDLHCGDGNEALIPYSYWMVSGDKKLDETSKAMVLAFGLDHIIIDKTRSKDISNSKYLGNTAILLSKPAITTESGYMGKSDEESIVGNINGILSVMKYFKMIVGSPEMIKNPVWIDKYEVVFSDCDGLFFPTTKMGYYVKKGEKIGYITDYLGEVCREYFAPFTGMILYIVNTPPMLKNEPMFEVGRIKK